MKQYFKRLWIALCGRNPYRENLERMREELAQAKIECEIVSEQKEQTIGLVAILSKKIEETDKQVASYQTLVENLRERIAEKDEMIAQMRHVTG